MLTVRLPSVYNDSQIAGRTLLALKRDIFNLRTRAPSKYVQGLDALGHADRQQVTEYLDRVVHLRSAETLCEEAYLAELAGGMERALGLFENERIRRAMEVTNQAVFEQVGRWRKGHKVSSKSRTLMAMTLARYGLRASLKTSPLSTLGSVAVGRWHDEGRAPPAQLAIPDKIHSRLSLRIAAVENVFRSLFADISNMADRAMVGINSSLGSEDGKHVWLRPEHEFLPEFRVQGTRLSILKSASQLPEFLRKLFESTKTMPLDVLFANITMVCRPGSTGEANSLLDAAWRQGLLVPALPETEDVQIWAEAAAGLLKPELQDAIKGPLGGLHQAVARCAPIAEIEAHFADLLQAAGSDLGVERFRPIVFEDCNHGPQRVEIPAAWSRMFEDEFRTLLSIAPLLSYDSAARNMRRRIRDAFVDQFGTDGACHDVLGFLRRFCEYDRLNTSNAEEDTRHETGDSEQAMQALRDSLLKLLRPDQCGDDVFLDCRKLGELAQAIPNEFRGLRTTQMLFGQLVNTGSETVFVLNQLYPGALCLISRFLPDDETTRAEARAYLASIAGTDSYIELVGLFGFNASLHPTLADRTMSIPPIDILPQCGRRGNVALDQLSLRLGKSGDVELFEGEGPVALLYLSLLTLRLMPDIYRACMTFALPYDNVGTIWMQVAGGMDPDEDGILRIPRISMGNMVLVRRSLVTPAHHLPSPDLAGFDFFRKFNEWAERSALPRYCFFHRVPFAQLEPAPSDRATMRQHQRLTKPMPLDRHCPIGIQLLQRSLASSAIPVVFTEALPAPTQTAVTAHGEGTIMELGIELTQSWAA